MSFRSFSSRTRGEKARHRRMDALDTRERNRTEKAAERCRRDERLREKLSAGTLPYTPAVMSWLSAKLGKPSSRITQEDVKQITG